MSARNGPRCNGGRWLCFKSIHFKNDIVCRVAGWCFQFLLIHFNFTLFIQQVLQSRLSLGGSDTRTLMPELATAASKNPFFPGRNFEQCVSTSQLGKISEVEIIQIGRAERADDQTHKLNKQILNFIEDAELKLWVSGTYQQVSAQLWCQQYRYIQREKAQIQTRKGCSNIKQLK